jgi:hypothetical protein
MFRITQTLLPRMMELKIIKIIKLLFIERRLNYKVKQFYLGSWLVTGRART